MNVVWWIVQGLLALLCVAGGFFKVSQPAALAGQFPLVPAGAWRVIGVLEIACGALLVAPIGLVPAAAVVVLVETVALSALYARASTKLVAANPLVFSVAMAAMAALVAWGRAG